MYRERLHYVASNSPFAPGDRRQPEPQKCGFLALGSRFARFSSVPSCRHPHPISCHGLKRAAVTLQHSFPARQPWPAPDDDIGIFGVELQSITNPLRHLRRGSWAQPLMRPFSIAPPPPSPGKASGRRRKWPKPALLRLGGLLAS